MQGLLYILPACTTRCVVEAGADATDTLTNLRVLESISKNYKNQDAGRTGQNDHRVAPIFQSHLFRHRKGPSDLVCSWRRSASWGTRREPFAFS